VAEPVAEDALRQPATEICADPQKIMPISSFE
jgi:hypothetical protein